MCGIVGYIGKEDGVNKVIEGLELLEYRGYDSAGIACLNNDSSGIVIKEAGKITNLKRTINKVKPSGKIIIGHTRWATHGKPSKINSHPLFNNDQTIFVVHNGIIENYQEIKNFLKSKGYKFYSETDTEVIPNLIDYYYKKLNNFKNAIKNTLNDLKGTYGLLISSTLIKDRFYLARLGSPLIIGFAKDYFIVASDQNVLAKHTKQISFLNDYDLAEISFSKVKVENLKTDLKFDPKIEVLELATNKSSLNNFKDYMLKEIFDIPSTIKLASRGRINFKNGTVKLGGLDVVSEELAHIDRIIIVACGTSYYAGLYGEYLLEEYANIPVEVVLASEFKYKKEPISRSTCVIAISQSGETADTIAALNKVEGFGVLRLGIVNVIGSTISRITDAGVYCHAGLEMSVASTKAFISQVTILLQIALWIRNRSDKTAKALLKEIDNLPTKVDELLKNIQPIKNLAKKYSKYKNFLYIGRSYNYPIALEGALKLKEVSYIHAEGYAAGEMKHGPLALIDNKFPSIAILGDGQIYSKTLSNVEEIKARGGPVVAITSKKEKKIDSLVDDVLILPKSSGYTETILASISLQLFAYFMAKELRLNVDKPRNLAKSVTVE